MMLFRRKESLPMAVHSGAPDGSGRGIQMDSPLHRVWREASPFMKGTYIMLVVSLLITYSGYRHLRNSHASLWLSCRTLDCSLEITPSSGRRSLSVTFARKQLLKVDPVRIDGYGNFVKIDEAPPFDRSLFDERRKGKRKKDKKKKKKRAEAAYYSRGIDENGHYLSYEVILKQPQNVPGHYDDDAEEPVEDQDVSALLGASIGARRNEQGHIVVPMRPFNYRESRRRPRSMVSRIESYIKQRRHKLTIKESKGLSWQGILMLVFGIFALLMTVLIGQFREERPHQGGHGMRRKHRPRQRQQAKRQQTQNKKTSYPVPKAASGSYNRSVAPSSSLHYGNRTTASTTVQRKKGID